MCDNVSDSGKMDDWTYLGFPLVHRIRCSRTTLELGRNIGEKEKHIRKEYCLYIQSMRKIHLLGFSIQRLWGKSLEISRNFSVGP